MDHILKCENICKSFKKNNNQTLDILKGVSLSLEREKITVIVGASGAGKSTLLHILGGLDKPDSGSVVMNNTNLFQLSDDKLSDFRNEHLGFVFQFHHLLPEFTALENVNIPQMIRGISPKKAEIKSKEILEIVGLAERIHHKPSELSGGEQQRVAMARALVNNPSIMFGDEPTGNLDSKNSELVHQLFLDLKNKYRQTLLLVTHNPELVKLADIVFEMKDGLLLEN